MALDLIKIEKSIDRLLAKETKSSLRKWFKKHDVVKVLRIIKHRK